MKTLWNQENQTLQRYRPYSTWPHGQVARQELGMVMHGGAQDCKCEASLGYSVSSNRPVLCRRPCHKEQIKQAKQQRFPCAQGEEKRTGGGQGKAVS